MVKLPTTDREVKAFKRFLKLLPHGQDMTLVILKGHLLIEEQVRQIISERVKDPRSLEDARLECGQAICMAQALTGNEVDGAVWKSVKKLNKLRNEIAHNSEPKGVHDRIKDFVNSTHSGLGTDEEQARFEMNLWSLFVAVSSLVERPSAEVLKLINK